MKTAFLAQGGLPMWERLNSHDHGFPPDCDPCSISSFHSSMLPDFSPRIPIKTFHLKLGATHHSMQGGTDRVLLWRKTWKYTEIKPLYVKIHNLGCYQIWDEWNILCGQVNFDLVSHLHHTHPHRMRDDLHHTHHHKMGVSGWMTDIVCYRSGRASHLPWHESQTN